MKKSRYQSLYGSCTHYKSSKFLDFGDENQFRYKKFPIPAPRIVSCTKFGRYRFRDFFPVQNFADTGSETFFRCQFVPIPVLRLFIGTKFCRYRFRDFLSVPNLTDTGSATFFQYQFVPIPVTIPPKKLKIPGTGTSHSGVHDARLYVACIHDPRSLTLMHHASCMYV